MEYLFLFLKGSLAKLWPFLAFGIGAIAVVLGFKASGKKEGRQEIINKVNNETREIQEKWNEIDSRHPDYHDALDRLRKHQRSND